MASKKTVAAILVGVVLCLMAVVGRNGKVGSLMVDRGPDLDQLTGEWTLMSWCLESVVSRVGRMQVSPKITLKRDGGFEVINFPFETNSGSTKWEAITGKGRWQIETRDNMVVELVFGGGRGTLLDLRSRKQHVIQLSVSVLSPDSGEFWIWEKTPNKNKGSRVNLRTGQ